MVVMDPSANEDKDESKDVEIVPYDEEDIKKGESGVASSSSSERITSKESAANEMEFGDGLRKLSPEEEIAMAKNFTSHHNVMKKSLDLDSIKIDEKELAEISKSSREHQEKRANQNNEFANELKSIIGNINSKALALKSKLNLQTDTLKPVDQPLSSQENF